MIKKAGIYTFIKIGINVLKIKVLIG